MVVDDLMGMGMGMALGRRLMIEKLGSLVHRRAICGISNWCTRMGFHLCKGVW